MGETKGRGEKRSKATEVGWRRPRTTATAVVAMQEPARSEHRIAEPKPKYRATASAGVADLNRQNTKTIDTTREWS